MAIVEQPTEDAQWGDQGAKGGSESFLHARKTVRHDIYFLDPFALPALQILDTAGPFSRWIPLCLHSGGLI